MILSLTACQNPCPTIETSDFSGQLIVLPDKPKLPSIKSTELKCLSDEAYFRLAERNRILRHYSEQLEIIAKGCTK